MTLTDQKTIVKRLAKAWLRSSNSYKDTNGIHALVYKGEMLANRYALEDAGLKLSEIIKIGRAENIDEYIESLFNKN